MKKSFLYALTFAMATGAFTSCSDDNNEDITPEEPIVPGSQFVANTPYTFVTAGGIDDNGLNLSVNGMPTLGKTVTFTRNNDNTGTLTVAGEMMDMSEMLGELIGGLMPSPEDPETKASEGLGMPTPGILPGTPVLNIPVTLEGDNEETTFSGSGESDFCTYSYSGTLFTDSLDFKVTDVKLKDTSMAGTYEVPTYVYNDDTWEYEGINPTTVTWESSKQIELMPGFGMPVQTIVSLMLVMPMIPSPFGEVDEEGNVQPLPIFDVLPRVLKTVTFGEDGNIYAHYVDTKDPAFAEKDSPAGVAQYVVDKEGQIRIFLNPQQIAYVTMMNAMQNTRALDIESLLGSLMTQVLPMVQNGIPMTVKPYQEIVTDDWTGEVTVTDTEATSFVLTTETLLPLFKMLAPVVTDPDMMQMIIEKASADPNMGSMASMLEPILTALPEIIDGTTNIEVGINMVKK